MQMTIKGEMIMGAATAKQQTPNSKGIAQITGQGTMWTYSPRLAKLNGGRWNCDGEYDANKEIAEIRVNFDTSFP